MYATPIESPLFHALTADSPGHVPAPGMAPAPDGLDPFDDDQQMPPWTDEDVVYLHWRMLRQVGYLADPKRPLSEKFDILRWVFSDHDDRELSFARCVRVACCSPLSPIPYCGLVDAESVRDYVRTNLRRWLMASLERYPAWVVDVVLANPMWVQERMARNPQWLNEQVKQIRDQGDLFA